MKKLCTLPIITSLTKVRRNNDYLFSKRKKEEYKLRQKLQKLAWETKKKNIFSSQIKFRLIVRDSNLPRQEKQIVGRIILKKKFLCREAANLQMAGVRIVVTHDVKIWFAGEDSNPGLLHSRKA